jgi:Ku70/Ku80 beta-barrel domain
MFASFNAKPNVEQREIQNNQSGLARFRSFYYFIDELIPMQSEDMKRILKLANGEYEPGLTILGFKPRDSIPFYHSIHLQLIIYPNDKIIQGSTTAFAQLHAAMLRKNVLAIGEVQFRKYLQSRLVAIYPLKKTSNDEETGKPAGMLVMTLPFEDDIRAIAPDEASKEFDRLKVEQINATDENKALSHDGLNSDLPEHVSSVEFTEDDKSFLGSVASQELVAAAMKLIARLTVNKDAELIDVPNVALDDFYSYLKSVALDLPHEKVGRLEKMDASMLSSKANNAIENFISLLPDDLPPQKKSTARPKRARDLPPDPTGIDWKSLYEAEKLASCKNDDLKACLRSLGKSD